MAPQLSLFQTPSSLVHRSEDGPHYVSTNSLLVDDSDPTMFSFPEGRWKVQPDTQWYGGMVSTYAGPSSSSATDPPDGGQGEMEESMTLHVDALEISLTGMAPLNSTRPFYISFDDGPPVAQAFAGPSSSDASTSTVQPSSTSPTSTYRTWFTTPLQQHFVDGVITSRHNITFYNLPAGLSIDYARLTFGADFELGLPKSFEPSAGQRRLVVDDSDPSIDWLDESGAEGGWDVLQREWSIASSEYRSEGAGGTGALVAEALGDTVHSSSTVGSSATVYFWGTGMSLYGFLPREGAAGGAVSVTYRVDKGPNVVRKYNYGSSNLDSPASVNGNASGWGATFQQHFELYGVEGLEDRTHMLQFNITEISASSTSPALYIDYFTRTTSQSPAVLAFGANSNPVPDSFLREMQILGGKPKGGLGTPYIVAVVVLSIASLVLLYFGRKFLVIGLAWILKLGDTDDDVDVKTKGKGERRTHPEEGRREKRKRKHGVVRRFARTVRLDLEFSWHRAECVLRSTILDIRPRTPPPASSSNHTSQTTTAPSLSSQLEQPAPAHLPTERPRRPLPTLPDTPPAYTEDPIHPTHAHVQDGGTRRELSSVREYLSRINARLAAAVVGAGAVGRDWVLGSVGGWGSRGQETLPAYQTMDSS